MNNIILLVCFVISMVSTLLIIPLWMRKARVNGLVGRDVHKLDRRKVVEMGGVPVITGFLFGLLVYVALTMKSSTDYKSVLLILASLSSLLITTIIGILDDVLGWKIGLRQYEKPFITLLAAIPIAVILDSTDLHLPFIGSLEMGVFYSLLVVPAVILVTTNGFNMIAGYNGLEAGMGILILSTLGLISFYKFGLFWPGAIAFIMVFALIPFLVFNFYPAKIFPGDSLTYSVGALIGIIAIFLRIEWVLLILFLLYGVEFFLKLRAKMQQESFSKVRKDGTLYVNGVYGVEHLAVRVLSYFSKVKERNVVFSLWFVEILLCLITWVIL